MIQKTHTHSFEIVPLEVDFHRDKGRIRKPMPYATNYLKACKICTYAEMINASQIIQKKKKRRFES